MRILRISIYLITIFLILSCTRFVGKGDEPVKVDTIGDFKRNRIELGPLPDSHITDFQVCDILVKPNVNWLPGTTHVPGGIGFGHAAVVIRPVSDTSEALLLSKVLIIEAQARDVEAQYQVRTVKAFQPGYDYRFASYNFNPASLGRFYRLRMPLTDEQKNEILSVLLESDNDMFSTRAAKDFNSSDQGKDSVDKIGRTDYWYCSLIVWQSFYDVLGIDLDANKGLYVYPNDLINSPYFDYQTGQDTGRVRF